MNFSKSLFIAVIIILMYHFSLAQDNGNIYEFEWQADIEQHRGGASEMGVFPASLDIDQNGVQEFLVYDHIRYSFTPIGRIRLWSVTGPDSYELVWEQVYPDYESRNNPGNGITVADLDKDGKQEVLVAVENAIYIYEWDGSTFDSGGGLPDEPTRILDAILDGQGQATIR